MALVAHFLNVGHGDCTFLELPSGRLMMIDINNSTSLPDDDKVALAAAQQVSIREFAVPGFRMVGKSLQQHYESLLVDPYDYYKAHFSGQPIHRYVQTHPDLDHMGGLHRFFWQEKVPLLNFWDVDHGKTLDSEDFEGSPHSRSDWLVYRLLRQGAGPDDSDHMVFHNTRSATGRFWTDDEIQVLSPTADLIDECNTSEEFNDCSHVLKVSYAGRSIILPGDAGDSAWKSMVDELHPVTLNCDILKAAHHGRKSGFHQEAVAAMDPSIVVCSVGKKPATDAAADYRRYADDVLSTRFHGTIKVKIWSDGEVWVTDHSGKRVATLPPLGR
jgi:hypothetical protein